MVVFKAVADIVSAWEISLELAGRMLRFTRGKHHASRFRRPATYRPTGRHAREWEVHGLFRRLADAIL